MRVDGLDAFADSVAVKEHVGYLPDEPAFYDFMRGSEIIRFAGEMHGLPRSVIQERGSKLAERLHLADALGEFAENYSRGMKKKLGLICALLHEPELLILDEPTNGLDPQGTLELHGLMRESLALGRTVIFSTHLLDQAEKLCDRVAVVNHGKIAAEGTLAELRQRFGVDSSLEALFFKLTEGVLSTEPAVASQRRRSRSPCVARPTSRCCGLFTRVSLRRAANRSTIFVQRSAAEFVESHIAKGNCSRGDCRNRWAAERLRFSSPSRWRSGRIMLLTRTVPCTTQAVRLDEMANAKVIPLSQIDYEALQKASKSLSDPKQTSADVDKAFEKVVEGQGNDWMDNRGQLCCTTSSKIRVSPASSGEPESQWQGTLARFPRGPTACLAGRRLYFLLIGASGVC